MTKVAQFVEDNWFLMRRIPRYRLLLLFALAGKDGYTATAAVGSHRLNYFGVGDLAGNAWE